MAHIRTTEYCAMNKIETCAKILKRLFDPYMDIEIDNWLQFASNGKIIYVKKNTVIKAPFTVEKELNFILSGSGGILKWHDKNFICLGFAFENNFLCDYNSFLDQKESDMETLVFEDSEIFQIRHERFLKMLSNERGEKLRRLIAEGILQSQQKTVKELMIKTALERYNDLLKVHPDTLNRIPHMYIASYLGITPQSLSRIRKNL